MGVQMASRMGAASATLKDDTFTIRFPSTANFLVDSNDRDDTFPDAGNFTITKKNSLFNGFFNRLAVVEVVMDWGIPNVAVLHQNTSFTFTYDFGAGPIEDTVFIPGGWYSVQQALDLLVDQMNVSVGTPNAFVIVSGAGGVSMAVDQAVVAGGTFEINEINTAGTQPNNLGLQIFGETLLDVGQQPEYFILAPRILPYNYLDFVSTQLTYNQDLKDADTSQQSRDVLYRWYFAWDTPTEYDSYGFPLLQGYRQFIQRRYIPFPKQIRWSSQQPIGAVSFQVYDDLDNLVLTSEFGNSEGQPEMEFQMTFLLSED